MTQPTKPKQDNGSKGGSGLKATFKDKRVQVGLAAAAVLGLLVLVRRGGAPVDSAGNQPGQSINTGTLDSTGMDSYNAIAQLGQGWQDAFTQGFADIRDQLANVKPPTPPAGTSTAVLPINPKLKTGQGFYFLQAGDTLGSIASAKGTTVEQLKLLNPGTLLNHMGVGEAIRLRAVAGPAPKDKKGRTLWR